MISVIIMNRIKYKYFKIRPLFFVVVGFSFLFPNLFLLGFFFYYYLATAWYKFFFRPFFVRTLCDTQKQNRILLWYIKVLHAAKLLFFLKSCTYTLCFYWLSLDIFFSSFLIFTLYCTCLCIFIFSLRVFFNALCMFFVGNKREDKSEIIGIMFCFFIQTRFSTNRVQNHIFHKVFYLEYSNVVALMDNLQFVHE